LTFEELDTVLTSIEAILNSRPLCPLSNDANDLPYLTAGHFLVGEPLNAPAEFDLTDVSIHRLSRWQHVERIRRHFWKRWSNEYLPYDATTTDPVDHIQGQGAACGFISANQGNQCTSTAVETWPHHSAAPRTRPGGACSVSEVQFK
jgi:hypothetical protein